MRNTLKYRIAETFSKWVAKLPPSVLARVVRDMAVTGRGTDECLRWDCLPVPVHYYQPIPDVRDLDARHIWDRRSDLCGIDLREANQLERIKTLGEEFGAECNWPADSTGDRTQFYTENGAFSFMCAASTHCLIRHSKPRRVFEIGSGNSSLVIGAALQANLDDGGEPPEYVVIDPAPRRLVTDGIPGLTRIVRERVELQDPGLFDALGPGDVLFIDSGHTVRIGSDVNNLILDILPRLSPGVYVHFHDIPLPYEYPRKYAIDSKWRVFWTEAYLLQAFLSLNEAYEVVLAMLYLQREHPEALAAAFPHYDPAVHVAETGSFWIRRRAEQPL